MARQINDAGLALIKCFESLRLEAYRDVAGIWTVGYGHTAGVTPGMVISEQQADQFLLDDLSNATKSVATAVGPADTSDNQFSAMVALCYNIGSGHFGGSTVLLQHKAGDFSAAADAFLLWNKATVGGTLQVEAGLTRRRTAERTLYLS